MASRVKKSTSTVRLTSSTPLISAAIPVRLKKAHLKILIPAVELIVRSYSNSPRPTDASAADHCRQEYQEIDLSGREPETYDSRLR